METTLVTPLLTVTMTSTGKETLINNVLLLAMPVKEVAVMMRTHL